MTGGSTGWERWPAATVLLTGLSASGKTTLARRLLRDLEDYGIDNAVLIDGEEFRAGLPRRYGHSLEDRQAVWLEVVREARARMDGGSIVIIAGIAHQASMRAMARTRLRPFFEVHLDCPVEVCAARDTKGHYRRALAGEYECFIGVTHPYEQTDADLRIDTAGLPPDEAASLLLERVLPFLATADPVSPRTPAAEWLSRLYMRALADKGPASLLEAPLIRNAMLRNAQIRRAVMRVEHPACAQLMVLFRGADRPRGEEFTGSELTFLKASGLFRRNLLNIRDPYLDNFSRGIGPEAPDAPSLARWIEEYARSLPHVNEVHAIGYSSGSYGALMFGHLCRMQTVWAFSPRTVRPRGYEEAMGRLRDMLSNHNGFTQYHILYAAANKRDQEFADWLTGCPGLTVHTFAEYGDSHALIMELAHDGRLREILPSFRPSTLPPKGALPRN